MRFVNPQKAIDKLGQSLPPEYQQRKEKIEEETRVLTFRCSIENREPTEEEIRNIVDLKRMLDSYICEWIEPS